MNTCGIWNSSTSIQWRAKYHGVAATIYEVIVKLRSIPVCLWQLLGKGAQVWAISTKSVWCNGPVNILNDCGQRHLDTIVSRHAILFQISGRYVSNFNIFPKLFWPLAELISWRLFHDNRYIWCAKILGALMNKKDFYKNAKHLICGN